MSSVDGSGVGRATHPWGTALIDALRAAGPPLLFGLRLWASVCLALYVAFWLELDNAYWAGTSAAIVCQPHLGASLRKGWYRMIGTVVGAIAIVVLTACFPQDRAAFMVGLALWGAVCALVATVLRNFAAYSAALAGYTAAIIASDQLGATGGPNGDAFMLAVTRVSEIWIGIVSAGIVLAGTDFGGARAPACRQCSRPFRPRSSMGSARTLTQAAGADFDDTQPVRRELIGKRRCARPGDRRGVRRILAASLPFAGIADGRRGAIGRGFGRWRTSPCSSRDCRIAVARQEADAVLRNIPQELRSAPEQGGPAPWMADPESACAAALWRWRAAAG